MQNMLQCWRDVTEREFPEMLHLLPTKDDITLQKLKDGGIMTDTCNSAQSCNSLISDEVDGVTYNLLCHNHLRNVWIKNVLESLTEHLRICLHDSLEEIAPEFRVSCSFVTFARAFDKMFSLCANYPKGWGEVFRPWLRENHRGELIFHVERAASGTRMDIAPMAALAIYWNRNPCVEFLEEMQVFCGREDNILANNLWHILTSTEMIAVTRMWSIFHLAIVMPIRWLAANTHKLKEYNWGYISMGKVLDKLKSDLESIVEEPELIHDESFMMGLMDKWADELPEFRTYLTDIFENEKQKLFDDESGTKVAPLRELRRELFHPTDRDNKECTPYLEEYVVIAAKRWITELTDPTKGTWLLLSESEGKLSWDHSSEDLKKALEGMVAVNDLAESSFAGVTAQVQVFGRVGMANAAAVSDMSRNGFLYRPVTKKEMQKSDAHGLFHRVLPEELKMTAVMAAMEQAPATRKANNHAVERQREIKRQREEAAKEEVLEKGEDKYIECLQYHMMWNTEQCWRTEAEVRDGMKKIKFKTHKETALRNNILMRYTGQGWSDCHVPWSKDGRKKSNAELQRDLIEIIKKTEGRELRDRPPSKVPQRKESGALGTVTHKAIELAAKRAAMEDDLDLKARKRWREEDSNGGRSTHQMMNVGGRRKLEKSFEKKRIEVLTSFDTFDDKGVKNGARLRWCGGVIVKVSDGTDKVPGGRTRRFKENEAAEIKWDPVEELDENYDTSWEVLLQSKWNKDCEGAWRIDLGDIDYGIKE